MLYSLINWCFIISTGVVVAKNIAADNRLKRLGTNIVSDKRSTLEIASSFVKDYAFLLVPGMNIVRAAKIFLTNDIEYSNKRLKKLKEYERISEKPIVKEEPAKKTILPPVVNKEINKMKENLKPIKQNETYVSCKDDILSIIDNSNDVNYLLEIKKIYREKSIKLREKYSELEKFPNTENERKKLVRRIKVYDTIFESARDRLVLITSKTKGR